MKTSPLTTANRPPSYLFVLIFYLWTGVGGLHAWILVPLTGHY